mgnify:CR=1 FL=1
MDHVKQKQLSKELSGGKKKGESIFGVIKAIRSLRNYGIGAQILRNLNIRKMILISKSKKNIIGLDGFGIKIVKQEFIK